MLQPRPISRQHIGWNAEAQETYIAPQIFASNEDAAALFMVGGSWGGLFGTDRFAKKHELTTKVIPVVAAGRQDISGGKNLEQTESDILDDVFATFPKEIILQCPRGQVAPALMAFMAVCGTARSRIHFMFSQSFGAATRGAFEWVEVRKRDGTLKSYRNKLGKVVILIIGMDDFQGCTNIYLSELPDWVLNGPRTLPPLEELFRFGRTE